MSQPAIQNSQSDNQSGRNGNNSSQLIATEDLSMNKIVDFLRDQQKVQFSRETEYLFEKQQMQLRINQLTAQLKAQENINNDLIRRIKMLEFSLRQERIKYAKLAQSHNLDLESIGSTDVIGQVLQKANLNVNLYERVAKRRAKAQRPLLLKFLQEIGYDDIFNVDEVNEIKALYDKAQEEMKENFENEINGVGDSINQKIEEKMLQKEEQQNLNDVQQNKNIEIIDGSIRPSFLKDSKSGQMEESGKIVQIKYDIRAHFDVVTDIQFIDSTQMIVSASEDCLVKLWNIKNIQKEWETSKGFIEPYFSFRGHKGPIYSIAAFKSGKINEVNQQNSNEGKVLFTCGQECQIKIWSIPDIQDKYPQTDGKTYFLGEIGTSRELSKNFYIQLRCHPFLNYLMALRNDSTVEIWDCESIIKNQISNESSRLQNLENLKPLKELKFMQSEHVEQANCCSWLQTDSNLCVIGYNESQVVFYDTVKGEITQQFKTTSDRNSSITCIAAHEFKPIIVTGQSCGTIVIYDFRQHKVLGNIPFDEQNLEAKVCVQSLQFLNNNLNLVVGYSNGIIKLFDFNSQRVLSIIEKSHQKKDCQSVNCLLNIKSQSLNQQDQISQNPLSEIPFFISGGADGQIRIYEYNPYVSKEEKIENQGKPAEEPSNDPKIIDP